MKVKVIAIVGSILAALALAVYAGIWILFGHPKCMGQMGDAEYEETSYSISMLIQALEEHKAHLGSYPTTADGIRQIETSPTKHGLVTLPLRDESSGLYVDAWKNPLVYESNGRTYKLYSKGKDGAAGTADDLPNEECQR